MTSAIIELIVEAVEMVSGIIELISGVIGVMSEGIGLTSEAIEVMSGGVGVVIRVILAKIYALKFSILGIWQLIDYYLL